MKKVYLFTILILFPLFSFASFKVNKSILCLLGVRPETCQSVSLSNIKIESQNYSQWDQSINSYRQVQGRKVSFSISTDYGVSQRDMHLPWDSLTDFHYCNTHSREQSASVSEDVDWKTFVYSEKGWNGAQQHNEFKISESKGTKTNKYVIQLSNYCENEWGNRSHRYGEAWDIELEEVPELRSK